MNMVQNAAARHLSLVPTDRRQRRRDQRRTRILEAADELIVEHGVGGITMQRVADRLDCAVGTLYLYFPSKAALVAALEGRGIDTLRASFETAEPSWHLYLGDARLEPDLSALVLLSAFGAHGVAASVVFADEVHLQRALLSQQVTIDALEGVKDVLPVLERLLEHPARLLTAAARAGAIDGGDSRERALLWISALDGVLLLENLAPLDRHLFRSQHLARKLTEGLLRGWGAGQTDVEVAEAHVQRLVALGPLAPPPEGPGYDD